MKTKKKILKHKIYVNHSTKKGKEERKNTINWKTMAINIYLSIITLNVNGLNARNKKL